MDAVHERRSKAGNSANAVLDGKVWSSRGFRSSASSKKATASSCLTSSWIQRLIPLSRMARFEESHDIKDMRIDLKTSPQMANQFDTPVYENSRTSKVDFYSTPFAVVAADRYSAALNAATSRSWEDTEVPPFSQCEVCVVPKSLPTVEALLPSYSQKVDERPTLLENGKLRSLSESAGLSNKVKQIVHFSADKRPKVSCSSIKGLDFASTNPPGAQSLRAGVHCIAKTEAGNKMMDCTKEVEVKHLHALGRTSNWNNWMGYKSCIGGTVAASEFSASVSLAGTTKPYSGGLDKANSSCSASPEEIGDGIMSASKEESWLPDGHLLPSVLGKRYRDHARQIDVVPEEKSVVKLELWMRRWFTAFQTRDLQGRPNVKTDFKSFAGNLPFFKGDDAKTRSTQLSPENFALVKRICHESSQYASKKKVPSGFLSATQSGQCHAIETSSHFLTPSAAAMAIMGTTARQVHGTQLQRTGLRIPIAQAETCKDLKIMSKPVKESLPIASAKPLAPVDM